MKKVVQIIIVSLAILFITNPIQSTAQGWQFLSNSHLAGGTHHTKHAEIFVTMAPSGNFAILQAIDKVQSSAMDGGGYFIGIRAVPTESPVGYPLSLFDKPLIDPPRSTSYCSGSTYSVFIESLNLMFGERLKNLSEDQKESIRMQELDGGRREDHIKFWGKWNADGFGSQFALVQYAGMGVEILPEDARAGDFMNISWKNGGGHSVIFLGWYENAAGEKSVLYWSSQTRTNGFGDELVPIDRIKEVKIVRMTNPEGLFSFDATNEANARPAGDIIAWE